MLHPQALADVAAPPSSVHLPPGAGDGHRAAHCDTDQSPYWDTGYIAVEYR